MLGGLTASEWEESDDEDWESESFESTLSSIAAFDMEGALERMTSGDAFYTPEAADSAHRASPTRDSSLSHERLRPSHDSRSLPDDTAHSLGEPGHAETKHSELSGSKAPAISNGPGFDLHKIANQVHRWSSSDLESMSYLPRMLLQMCPSHAQLHQWACFTISAQGHVQMNDRPADASSVSAAQTLSSDDNDSPRVIAWTAGRTMNRRHVLVCLRPGRISHHSPYLSTHHSGALSA